MKYRKKPIVVDAVQWFPGKVVDCVIYMRDAAPAGGYEGDPYPMVRTPIGLIQILPGEWIITENGKHYTLLDRTFQATYEPVEEE